MDKTIYDNGVINMRVRTVTEPEDVAYAAQVLAATRDALSDGVTQDGERGYWMSKCSNAAQAGGLLGLYVNGGQPVGAAVIERSTSEPGTALLLAASAMWDRASTEPALRRVAVDEAKAQGLRLYDVAYRVQALADAEWAIDGNGYMVPGVQAIVRRVVTPAE